MEWSIPGLGRAQWWETSIPGLGRDAVGLFVVLHDQEAAGVQKPQLGKGVQTWTRARPCWCQPGHHLPFSYLLPISASSPRVLVLSEVLTFWHSRFLIHLSFLLVCKVHGFRNPLSLVYSYVPVNTEEECVFFCFNVSYVFGQCHM